MFTVHVYDLTFISGGGGDVGGATGKKTAKPMTFVRVKPLGVVETFSAMFVVTKEAILSQNIIFT